MKTCSIILYSCALAALGIAGCDNDSLQPTASDAALKPASASAYSPGTAYPAGSSGGSTSSDSSAMPPSSTATQRPIGDFLSTQGTYCLQSSASDCMLYAPPIPNFLAWYVQDQNMTVAVDYAGLMDTWLRTHGGQSYGPIYNGSVYEQPLSDGRVRVTVKLDVMNAMAYMVSGIDLANGAARFGYKVPDLVDQKYSPATGHATLQLTFIRGAMGRPLPDLVQLLKTPRPDDQSMMSSFQFDGYGEFHNDFGQIQKAHVVITQQGQFMAGYPGMEYSTPPMAYASMQIMPLSAN